MTIIDLLQLFFQENEGKLSECRSKIKEKQTLIIQYETELQTVKFKSDPASVARMFTVKKTMDFLKKVSLFPKFWDLKSTYSIILLSEYAHFWIVVRIIYQ